MCLCEMFIAHDYVVFSVTIYSIIWHLRVPILKLRQCYDDEIKCIGDFKLNCVLYYQSVITITETWPWMILYNIYFC